MISLFERETVELRHNYFNFNFFIPQKGLLCNLNEYILSLYPGEIVIIAVTTLTLSYH